MCPPFYNLLMKIVVHEGVRPPRDGNILVRHWPKSIASLKKKSKSHSFAKQEKQNLSKTPKSEFVQHVTPSDHGSATHTTLGHTETTSPHIRKPQTISTQPRQSSSHADRLTILVEGLHEHISRLANVIYSTNS